MLYTFTCSPPPIHIPRVDTISDWQKLSKGNPIRSSDKPIFLPKGVSFLRVHDTVVRLCTEIKLDHAKEWNPSPVQQPGWSWAVPYDSFRGMIFPGNMKWMITEPREGTGVSWCRYEIKPLEPIKKVLEICSLISNTPLRTLLLTNTNQNKKCYNLLCQRKILFVLVLRLLLL